MQHRWIWVLFMAAALVAPGLARAGDAAALEILGFSNDGGIFAFEEYGVQDGSGFPYANRYYINTANDAFVTGTPIRVRLDDEHATVDAARLKAREQGEAILGQAELAANRGYTSGFNAITELSADQHRMAVNPRPIFPPIDPALEFRLEELAMDGGDTCSGLDAATVGFRLLRIGTNPGEATRLVQEDASIPQSRGCPLGYSIGAVQTFGPSGLSVYAVLIGVRRHGFEGPDHRWIAVTGKF